MKPSKFHTAYNPILFTFEDDTLTYEVLTVNIGGSEIELKREYINGVATFDVSGVVKNYFAEKLLDSINDTDSDIFKEPALYVNYSVGGNNYYAINAVTQIGTSLDYGLLKDKALTTLETLRIYDSYPFDISILCDMPLEITQGTLYANAINRVKIDSEDEINSIAEYLTTLGGDNILTLGGDNIVVGGFSIGQAEEICTPRNPFYVRWINYKGGVDYWMFGVQQTRNTTLQENQTYQRYITDYLNENGTDYSYYKRATKAITVGAEHLTLADFNALELMTLSPYIEVYENGKWIRIIIESSTTSRQTSDDRNSFECTFLLPELNLQY